MSDNKCSVSDCERTVFCQGLCKMHYTRFKRNGHTGLNSNWSVLKRGIPYLNKRGYMEFFSVKHGKKVRLHRYIMEEYLGRPLKPTEIVHHKNGDPLDNRIENLEVIQNQSEHSANHIRKYWAKRKQSHQYRRLVAQAKARVKKYKSYKRSNRKKHVGVKCFCGKQAHVYGMCKSHYAWALKNGLTK